MISLITCSVIDNTYKKFKKSVEETIGVEHEIIRIDNSKNQHSICKAYNLGGTKAKFEYLIFVHEDVTFITNWGLDIIKHLRKKSTGLIGIAGSAYKPSVPSSWSLPLLTALHIVQKDKKSLQDHECRKINKLYDDPAEVITLDGVFLATKKIFLAALNLMKRC